MKSTQPRSENHESGSCSGRGGHDFPQMRHARAELLQAEGGIALLIALWVILILSGLALSMMTLTTSQTQLAMTMETQTKVYYAALAGTEEARGRLDPAAPDFLGRGSFPSPPSVNQVVYLVNGTRQNPVQPTNTASPYYDSEYAREFPGGLAGANVLPAISSDQPGAGTTSTIPYKWVRITLKTEYSSGQDVNQDGKLDTTTPVYWDGTHQNLTGTGVPVYKLTALAVSTSGMRQMAQVEVAGRVSPYSALGSLATGGAATLTGAKFWRGGYNLQVSGTDTLNNPPCGSADVPGLVNVGTASISNAQVTGTPVNTQQVTSLPSSPAAFINSVLGAVTPILSADPKHVSLAGGGKSYTGTNVLLGSPVQPAVVYADKPLTISGFNSTGNGILLVSGNLSITGGFNYQGLIVVDGSVTLASSSSRSISIRGSVISSGNLSVNSTQSTWQGLTALYDSCAIINSLQRLPQTVLAFRLL